MSTTVPSESTRQPRYPQLPRLLLAVLIAAVPLRAAHAYVDPNTVGPLYQVLFPLLLAVTSTLAAFRRAIARTFRRIVSSGMAMLSGARPRKTQSERPS